MAMCSIDEAVAYIEAHREPKSEMPDRIINMLKYRQKMYDGVKPKYYKAKRSSYSYWYCGNCGGRKVDVGDNYCPGCGCYIKWDSPRCLTGYDDPEDEPGEKEEEHETD